MIKTSNILLAILLAFNSWCQEFIEFTSSETTKPTYNVLASEDTIVEFEVQIPGVFVSEVDSFQRVEIKDHSKMDSVGFPEVPFVSFLVAIPECDNVNLTLEWIDSVKIGDMFIYPVPELVYDTAANGMVAMVEQFAYNQDFYGSDSWWQSVTPT